MACERPSEDLVSTSLPFDPLQHVRRAAETVGVGPCWVGGKHSVRVQVDLQGGEIPWVELEKLLQEERVPEIVSVVIRDAQRLEKNLSLFATFRKRFPKLALAIDLGDQGVLFPQVVPMVDKVSVCPDRTLNEEGWKNQALEILRVAKLWPASLEWKVDENVETLVELAKLAKLEQVPVHLCWQGSDVLHHNRYLAARLKQENLYTPLRLSSPKISQQDHLLLCGELGSLLIDGLGDIISIPLADPHAAVHLAYNLLQGCRVRLSKTEFIACPSCGRTQFDLQTTTQKVKANTSHLKGVKIAIMGCIVNGPGEMADADFGYVGGGPGRIHLYVGKECVEKNLPSEVAVEKLIDLIKAHGKWVEPIQVTA
ncbi:MAG: flavodoxin-dependent (E)-4-hydroxy-3-methylbut-2-enyl-diphosphate synthase [Deltaproteobacteria bacterium]|nr:flavodoxin-dependent (E)-4-hydroxy-3-methylbut-2-enyl-diphosphate synthase [Deltaproteobacteria bacterium]